MEIIYKETLNMEIGDRVEIPVKKEGNYWLIMQQSCDDDASVYQIKKNYSMVMFRRVVFFKFVVETTSAGVSIYRPISPYLNSAKILVGIVKDPGRSRDIMSHLMSVSKLIDSLKDQICILQEALDRPENVGASIGWEEFRKAMDHQHSV